MELNHIYNGDALEILKTLPSNSVDCGITSPPYYGLRDYGVDGQIGLDDTPEKFISRLVEVFREFRRVLKPEGTLWVNIGDSYAGSGKGGATHPENTCNYKQGTNRGLIGKAAVTKVKWSECKPKDLIGIPWMLAFALRADGWYLRQDIIWHKPNPMPESVTDRCTKAHEYIFLLSKSQHYYYDHEAISEPYASKAEKPRNKAKERYNDSYKGGRWSEGVRDYYSAGKRNKRSVWTVATKPFKEAHFATFPEELITPCILAGCPQGGIVLDMFFGAGTTGLAALKNFRNFVGIELNPEYVKMAERRLQPYKAQQSIFDYGVGT